MLYGVLLSVPGMQIFLTKWLPPLEPQQPARVIRAVLVPPKPVRTRIPNRLSRKQLIHVLQHTGWPRRLRGKAIKIIACESSFNPRAVGRKNSNDIGVFQINALIHREKIPGVTIAEKKRNLMNPYTNARIAHVVYKEGRRLWGSGWHPWKASRRCHRLA